MQLTLAIMFALSVAVNIAQAKEIEKLKSQIK